MNRLSIALQLLRTAFRNGGRALIGNLWSADNTKVLAYELARQRSTEMGLARAPLAAPPAGGAPLASMVCTSTDWKSEWLPYWASQLGLQPALHRKIWEFAFITQALHGRNMLRNGRSGLGFGCGKEPLASLFAARGCEVLATDLPAGDARSRSWTRGEQHADSLQNIWMPSLCPAATAERNLRFEPVDMNRVPPELHGRFDFCWSACALEHLGSIRNGLRFIRESTRCLRPGGVAVHTTELNLDSGRTLDDHPTVLFHPAHFEQLSEDLASEHVHLEPIVERPGDPFLDAYVDTPPYPNPSSVGSTLSTLHLRLLVASFRTTSVGLVLTRA
jgi:SAM-dependent methyltransferase